MHRTALVTAAALAAGLAGCTPAPRPAPVDTWVIQGSGYSRGADGERWSVYCVPAAEQHLDWADISVVREIAVGRDASYGAVDGEPCPPGLVLDEF